MPHERSASNGDVGDLRQAVETLLFAIGDPEADRTELAAAHRTVLSATSWAAPVIARWVETFVADIAQAEGPADVERAVLDLSRNFKLPVPRRVAAFGEQGVLFD